ncbi:MAG: hypothetical protein DWH79_05205 [Planctomycetota bacterium]|nr:MAG: hypothetical protein DWH79_05205 [Planctomycetota bacterium]
MVLDRWQFTAPPFGGGSEPATFHPGAPQDEALARLEWLVEQGQRCALVVGAEGCGKSHLCPVAARRLGGMGCEVAILSLRGISDDDWLALLLARLPLDPPARDEPLRLWQKLEDRLRENTLLERTTALVFDDADHAPQGALDGLARIVSAAEPLYARTLVVVTATPAGAERLPSGLRQRAAVRIELGPWDEEDVAAYLAGALRRVGGSPQLFSPQAVATLARFSDGVPGTVQQLARLAVAAAAGDGLENVDAATVERAWRDLRPRMSPASVNGASDQLVNPQVRVVRRLWG